MRRQPLSTAHDKPLFTPGPLTTSRTVKEAMLRDLGSRDHAFRDVVRSVRDELLALAGVSKERGYETVILQGSGTFGVESVLSSVIGERDKLLALVNGAYGERLVAIAKVHRLDVTALRNDESEPIDASAFERALANDPSFTHVAVVHCETTTGIVNPVAALGEIARAHDKRFIVDSMSAFGALPLDVAEASIDFLVSSANKCIEGVPGFSFVIARREALLAAEGGARTLSLDLVAQWRGLEQTGQFRFTPPTHALLAFAQALRELADEGGIAGRNARYRENHEMLLRGMAELGFRTYLRPELQAPIITSFHYPAHPQFRFEAFYEKLADRGFVIYPGKVSKAECFRIGTIGRIFPSDIRALLGAIADTMRELGIATGGT